MIAKDVKTWAAARNLEPVHIDCVTAVMLKILDGKCKMNEQEKTVMAALYDSVKHHSGIHLGETVHSLIAIARTRSNANILEDVYEQRLYAETMISRPVMKAFKAMLREHGLFELQ